MALPLPARPTPDFLAFVGDPDRKPWRVLLWLVLAVISAGIGELLVIGLTEVADPVLIDALSDTPPDLTKLTGYGEQSLLIYLFALRAAAVAAAFVAAGVLVFRRPPWTFVTPVRSFDFRIWAAGTGIGALTCLTSISLDLVQHVRWIAPILDLRTPAPLRAGYGLAAVLSAILAAAAVEITRRGVSLQILGAVVSRRWLLCLLNGALFAVFDGINDPGVLALQFVIGSALAWTVLELGGVELAIGFQVTAMTGTLLFQAPPTVLMRPGPARLDWTDAAEAAFTVGALAAAVLIARRRRRARS